MINDLVFAVVWCALRFFSHSPSWLRYSSVSIAFCILSFRLLLSRICFIFFIRFGCACRENAAATSNSVRVNNYSTCYVDAIICTQWKSTTIHCAVQLNRLPIQENAQSTRKNRNAHDFGSFYLKQTKRLIVIFGRRETVIAWFSHCENWPNWCDFN